MKLKFILCAFISLLFTTTSHATIINIGTTNSGSNDCTIGCMQLYQQSYDSSYFGTEKVNIADFSIYTASGSHNGTYNVFMSYVDGNYDSLTTNFEDNKSEAEGWTWIDVLKIILEIIFEILAA